MADCLRHRASLFAVSRTVTLGRTNALGGVYFAAYFDWCGEVREEWLVGFGSLPALEMHTSEARIKYLREMRPFERFDLLLWPRVRGLHLSLRFFFLRNEEGIAVGDQVVCFKSAGQVISPPGEIVGWVQRWDPGRDAEPSSVLP